ncbi:hypothetical protein, partial [Vibrio harveyi]
DKFDISFMNENQKKIMRKVAEADKSGNLIIRSYTNEFLKVMHEGRKFNLTPIEVEAHRVEDLMKHILGDGLSYDSFERQVKYTQRKKCPKTTHTVSDNALDLSYETYKNKKNRGLVQ